MSSCFSELHISTLEIFRLNILSKYLFFSPLDKSVSSFVFDFSSELCGNLLSLSSYFHSGQNLPKILRKGPYLPPQFSAHFGEEGTPASLCPSSFDCPFLPLFPPLRILVLSLY